MREGEGERGGQTDRKFTKKTRKTLTKPCQAPLPFAMSTLFRKMSMINDT